MGVIVRRRKDKSGVWAFIHHKGQRMKRRFDTEKAARQFAEALSAQLKVSEFGGNPLSLARRSGQVPTITAYVTDWLTTYAQVHCKPTTAKGYRNMITRHIVPEIGHCQLHEVTRADIKRLIAHLMGKGLKKQTVHNILTPLKEAYQHAVDEGIVPNNPVARTGRLTHSREDRRIHIRPLTNEEVNTLLQAAIETLPHIHALLMCAVRTGLRQGELIGLQWSDFDFRSGYLEVRRAVVRRQETSTKTHKLRRVDLSPQLVETLRRVRETRDLESSLSGTTMSDCVFVTKSGQRWDDSNLRRAFHKLLSKAGLRRVRFHDLRHTYASLLLQTGAPPKYIQEQLGHSSIQVTMDIYAHLCPSGNREWSARLDEPTQTRTLDAPCETGLVTNRP